MTGREELDNHKMKRVYKRIENVPQYVKDWALNLYSNNEASTCEVWVGQVIKFLRFVNEDIFQVNINALDKGTLERYFSTLKNMSGSYKCTTRSCLRNFFSYLNDHGYDVKVDYIPKAQKGLTRQDLTKIKANRVKYTKKDYKEFVIKAYQEKNPDKKVRNIAILYLLANTGIREGAVVTADVQGLNEEDMSLTVTEKEHIVVKIPLDTITWDAIQKWLKVRPDYIDPNHPTDALFVTQKKSRIDTTTVSRIIKKYTGHSPHKLRANFATNAKANGADLLQIQVAMNHMSLETTKRYFIEDEEAIRRNIMSKAVAYHKM